MKEIINFLRLLWELPQNLLGFILFQVYSLDCMCMEVPYGDVRILYSERMKGGISLGRFIILPWRYRGDYSKGSYIEMSHMHEWGHTRQSLYLGWLYLVVIGLRRSFGRGRTPRSGGCGRWTTTRSGRSGGLTGSEA